MPNPPVNTPYSTQTASPAHSLTWSENSSNHSFYRFDALTFPAHNIPLFNHTRNSTLTHWGRVTHICVGRLTNIGSDNGLSPGRRQAIIWTSAGISLIGPFRTNFSEILFGIQTFSFKNMHLKMSSAKWRPFCLGLNVLISTADITTKQANTVCGNAERMLSRYICKNFPGQSFMEQAVLTAQSAWMDGMPCWITAPAGVGLG